MRAFHQISTNTPEAKAFSKSRQLLIAAPWRGHNRGSMGV
jgi:hypothetical protein